MSHYAPVVAALFTMLLITILLFSKTGMSMQDIPNERSLHDTPVPRIGGMGLMAGILLGWTLMLMSLAWWIVIPLLVLFGVSLLDDKHNLPVRQRLLAHIVAAGILLAGSGLFSLNILLALLLLPVVVWMTNLYNFMDGSDGLAGGMAFFGFTMYGVAALMHGGEIQAMLNFSIGAAALGFLYYNFYPAKVFMGDAGSIPLGFLAAAMGLWGWQNGHWPAWFPLMVFSPFIVDASVTLFKRTLRGQKIWLAHREHYYQRMVQMGLGHRTVALIYYALMFAVGTSAIYAIHQPREFVWIILLTWTGVYALLMILADNRWRAFQRGQHG